MQKKSMQQTYEQVLGKVKTPFSNQNIVADGHILDMRETDRSIHITVQIDSAMHKGHRAQMELDIKSALIPVTDKMVKVILTAEKHDKDAGISQIKHIIAVASGKGGVGKSTTAINLAYAYQNMGKSVGILDADVFGPSIPTMMGLNRAYGVDKGAIIPVNYQGIKAMSMGHLVPEDKPIVWRGPMVMGAIQKLLNEVRWGALDVLFIDMPPGTGDTQLSISQHGRLTGAVIVSTPQDVALIDARKAMGMFTKVKVPILGMIENMSVFVCPNCTHATHIFGTDGTKAEAEKQGVHLLGDIPLQYHIRQTMDAGQQDQQLIEKYYLKIAQKLESVLIK